MHSALKDERFRGKKVALLDRSTFQGLTPNELNDLCNLYAILCTPNFLYECMQGNLEQRLLDIDDSSFVMIRDPQAPNTLYRYDIVKRDLTSLDDHLVALICVNEGDRQLMFPLISADSDFFYQMADSELKFFDDLFGDFRNDIVDSLGGDRRVVRDLFRRAEQQLGYRLHSSKIDDICKFAESQIPSPRKLIGIFRHLMRPDGTRILNGAELEATLNRLSLYNNRPIETNFLRYSRYYYFLGFCLIAFRAFDGEHRDDSYVRDWEYLYYLPFCDLFVSNDNFLENFVPSLPQSFGLNDKFVSTDKFCEMNGWQNVMTRKKRKKRRRK